MAKDRKVGRWGAGIRADSDFAREQILNAALICYQKYTYQNTRMEQIAAEAKVSRTTVYRHFQNRDEVALGVIFRELYGVLDIIRAQVTTESSFAVFIVETLVIADARIRSTALLEIIMRESGILMERIKTYSSEVVSVVGVYFRARFDMAKAAGELRNGIEYEDFIDWVSHIGASFVLMPTEEYDPNRFRAKLWRYLIPAIVREEAIPADKRG